MQDFPPIFLVIKFSVNGVFLQISVCLRMYHQNFSGYQSLKNLKKICRETVAHKILEIYMFSVEV